MAFREASCGNPDASNHPANQIEPIVHPRASLCRVIIRALPGCLRVQASRSTAPSFKRSQGLTSILWGLGMCAPELLHATALARHREKAIGRPKERRQTVDMNRANERRARNALWAEPVLLAACEELEMEVDEKAIRSQQSGACRTRWWVFEKARRKVRAMPQEQRVVEQSGLGEAFSRTPSPETSQSPPPITSMCTDSSGSLTNSGSVGTSRTYGTEESRNETSFQPVACTNGLRTIGPTPRCAAPASRDGSGPLHLLIHTGCSQSDQGCNSYGCYAPTNRSWLLDQERASCCK